MEAATVAANRANQKTTVPTTRLVINGVHGFVRNRHLKQERTVEIDVLRFLEAKGYVDVDMDSRSAIKPALRSVQRFLERHGYQRGRRKSGLTYHLSEKNTLARDTYV
ncbi:hypothetical protein DYB37_011365, partial [Aphanomyces astaci]